MRSPKHDVREQFLPFCREKKPVRKDAQLATLTGRFGHLKEFLCFNIDKSRFTCQTPHPETERYCPACHRLWCCLDNPHAKNGGGQTNRQHTWFGNPIRAAGHATAVYGSVTPPLSGCITANLKCAAKKNFIEIAEGFQLHLIDWWVYSRVLWQFKTLERPLKY